VEAYNPVARMH